MGLGYRLGPLAGVGIACGERRGDAVAVGGAGEPGGVSELHQAQRLGG